jgi:Flp pilus assembly protein TadD
VGYLCETVLDASPNLPLKPRAGQLSADLPEFNCLIEHPLTAMHNNNNDRKNKIIELKEELRRGKFSPAEEPGKLLELAKHCTVLNQNEKALGLMSNALSQKVPEVDILNYMGISRDNLGDHERAEKLYREAASVPPLASTPLFNLTLFPRLRVNDDKKLAED